MIMGIFETHIPELELIQRGKVRDLYSVGEDILMVATDRLSAFMSSFRNLFQTKGRS